MARAGRPLRDAYRWFCDMSTRWMDNDIYGHVNNVTYYSYFDTAANRYLIEHGGLDIHADPVVGFVVSSRCEYHEPLAFPQMLTVGLRVDRLGDRSVTWGIGIFRATAEPASAHGEFVHAFVDRVTGRSAPVPEKLATALGMIAVSA